MNRYTYDNMVDSVHDEKKTDLKILEYHYKTQ